MAETVLRKVLYGKEAVHGTPVAADTMLLGEVTLPESDRSWVIPGIGTGERVPGQLDAAFVRRVLAEGVQFSTPADRGGLYFQLLPVLLSMCIKGGVTPAEQTTAQNDYLWTFAAPLTAAESLDTITLECGDDARAYELAYCLVPEIEISGNCDSGEVSLTARLFGDKITSTTFTGAISAPAGVYVPGKLARLYVDATWAGLGGTEIADALVDWRLTIRGGAYPKPRGSASRLIDSHGQGEIEVMLSLGLDRAVAAVGTEEAYYRTATYLGTKRFLRLEIDSGIAIGTGDNHTLTFDIAGIWTAWHSIGRDAEGNTLDAVTLTMGQDQTSGESFTAKVTTNVASI